MDVLAGIAAARGKGVPGRPGLDRSLVTTGYLLSVPDAKGICAVSVLGSEPIDGVPAVPGDYTAVTSVRVLLDGGRPVQVLGPAGSIPVAAVSGATSTLPPPPAATTSTTVTVSKVILPTVSGTWRVPRASWGRWGDSADVYQGNSGESGQLWGLACYGEQITGLGASAILSATVTLAQNGGSGYSGNWVATVRGCASGTLPGTAPTYLGDTATATLPGAGKDGVAVDCVLPATVREQLRTGTTKSLGLVGAPYGATYGAGRRGNAWALALTYQLTT